MKKFISDFIDLVFPNCCPGCDQPFGSGEDHLCTSCEIDLPIFNAAENILNYFAGRILLADANAYLKFYTEGITQKLLHSIKYNGDQELGEHLGRMFIRSLEGTAIYSDVEVVVPIPLHRSKLKARGYNQSEALARGIASALELEVDTKSIIRVKKSETQTRKSRAERWQNVSGIFEVSAKNLRGRHVLLVDDVITTGATLEACGEALKAAGVSSLSIAALAAAMQ